MKKATIALLVICTAVFAQQKGTFKDSRDGKTYNTVKIGTQTWMAENLNYNAKGSKCYDNKPENCAKYGRLFDWATAMESCPSGWVLPDTTEWKTLVDFVDPERGLDPYGTKLKSYKAGGKLRAKSGCDKRPPSVDSYAGNGTDEFGFSALVYGNNGSWWTNKDDKVVENWAYYYSMGCISAEARQTSGSRSEFKSVRCLQSTSPAREEEARKAAEVARRTAEDARKKKEAEEAEVARKIAAVAAAVQRSSFTDPRDKKTYKTVKIGNQTWMAENLNYAAAGSKCYGEGGKTFIDWDKNNKPITKILSNAEVQANCTKYGRLYDRNTAMKVCPEGWHLPTGGYGATRFGDGDGGYGDWKTLVDVAGGKYIAKKTLKAKSGWNDFEGKSDNGTDDYGFSALPGGERYYESVIKEQVFRWVGESGNWFGATEGGNASISTDLYSVRCIRDQTKEEEATDKAAQAAKAEEERKAKAAEAAAREAEKEAARKVPVQLGSFTDPRDKKTYKTVKIDNQIYKQTWMAENL
ncbi:MAG: hypothetical protein LBQ87_10230, partial [Candidatus Fibromonas sp.]|nr:hypothetical protein [Candidatus Fibromonas sp.]